MSGLGGLFYRLARLGGLGGGLALGGTDIALDRALGLGDVLLGGAARGTDLLGGLLARCHGSALAGGCLAGGPATSDRR